MEIDVELHASILGDHICHCGLFRLAEASSAVIGIRALNRGGTLATPLVVPVPVDVNSVAGGAFVLAAVLAPHSVVSPRVDISVCVHNRDDGPLESVDNILDLAVGGIVRQQAIQDVGHSHGREPLSCVLATVEDDDRLGLARVGGANVDAGDVAALQRGAHVDEGGHAVGVGQLGKESSHLGKAGVAVEERRICGALDLCVVIHQSFDVTAQVVVKDSVGEAEAAEARGHSGGGPMRHLEVPGARNSGSLCPQTKLPVLFL
mmetsp:Transcript_133578/g.188760  ORF Transcript_133578/g.188760 Transcript_133578/m.188760 type:complete len:262 (-) Transcript_133578:179-964(-)